MFIKTLLICKNKNCQKNYFIIQYVEMLLIWTELSTKAKDFPWLISVQRNYSV